MASALSGVGEKTVASSVSVRDDLQATGVVTRVHLDAIAVTPVAGGGTVLDRGSAGRVLDALLTSVRANPRATGFLVDASRARPRVDALDVDARVPSSSGPR